MPYMNLERTLKILIFEADKGGAVVVMDRTYYADKNARNAE